MNRLTWRDEHGVAHAPIAIPCYIDIKGISADRLAAYEDSGLSPEQARELAEAKADGRLVVLPCKLGELKERYKRLTKPLSDDLETYTTGYHNGHKNGQAELIAYLLQIDTGTREAAEKAIAAVRE